MYLPTSVGLYSTRNVPFLMLNTLARVVLWDGAENTVCVCFH